MKFKKPLILLAVLLIVLIKGYAFESSMAEDILKYTNEYRKSKGKPPLKPDESINAQAEKHSENMASGNTPVGHQGFEGRIKALKTANAFISGAAENVAYGKMTARAVVDGWIKSPTHKKNLLGDYTHIGIGVATGQNGYLYFTQIFLRK